MILSASRRTDIPAFFGEWMVNVLRAGNVAVRNPVNPRQVTELVFTPESVECIVFWTKNPAPFLPRLDEIDALGYKYYFQCTITPYGRDIEPNLDKSRVTETFIELSERLGKEKVIWRYDPVIINTTYPAPFHAEQFEKMAACLGPYTEKCVISFVDRYAFLNRAFAAAGIGEISAGQMEETARAFCEAARRSAPGLRIASCCEEADLARCGVERNRCVDSELIARITGRETPYKKDPSQRPHCGCAVSRDIGTYNTCLHGCVYCYARRGKPDAAGPVLAH